MNNPVEQDLRQIERREWQLWILTLTLLMIFVGVTVVAYYILVDERSAGSAGIPSIAYRALPGLVVLIMLFCGYVLHTRSTFGKMRRLFEKQAMRDALTGLFNRQYLNDRMDEEIARADRNRSTVAVLLCDLDHFKVVNDTQGHHAGDEVLREVAKSIQVATRGSDLVFRWGGDEILVVLSETARDGVLTAADRIRKGVRLIGEKTGLPLDVSIGVALYPEHSASIDGLIRLADRALYIAKRGGDKVHIGEEEYRLDEQAVDVVFQPVVDVRSNRILGYEALSRDPQGKLPILELFKRYQAVGQLSELKCLCFGLQLRAAQKAGLERVFINVDFQVLDHLQTMPKPPGIEVILEISEAEALHDIEKRLRTTRKWRALGFKFAIDDFGAGFISLPFIAQLIPDYIKIDRSTIVQAGASGQFLKFLRDLILALRNYSKEGIIAEGIENEKELQVVKDLGVDPVQGFLLGKPQAL
jgi:diguanylate cyclase (GGDEF)-like protein